MTLSALGSTSNTALLVGGRSYRVARRRMKKSDIIGACEGVPCRLLLRYDISSICNATSLFIKIDNLNLVLSFSCFLRVFRCTSTTLLWKKYRHLIDHTYLRLYTAPGSRPDRHHTLPLPPIHALGSVHAKHQKRRNFYISHSTERATRECLCDVGTHARYLCS